MSRDHLLQRLRAAAPAIAPSMLKCDYGNLLREASLLERAGAPLLHWDAMDGHFVPNLSYGAMVIERLRDATPLLFDAHLMIAHPEKYLDGFLKAGCDAITFHIEAVPDPRALLKRIQDAGRIAGLALNPGTAVEQVAPFLSACDLVLVMSVEPGFGGQKFLPGSVDKLKALRSLAPRDVVLSVDGGIDLTTIGPTAAAGAQVFVAGSAIFDTADYAEAVDGLRRAALKARA